MAARQDNRRGIQRQEFSEEMIEATYTWRILPIYRWRRGQTVSNSNSRSPKSRITSRKFRSTEDAWYQPLLSIDLCHHGTRIWRYASFQF